MANKMIRDYDGKQLPKMGEIAVYWPLSDVTNMYVEDGFEFTHEPSKYGSDLEYPELIQFDYRAAAIELTKMIESALPYIDANGTPGSYTKAKEIREGLRAFINEIQGGQS